MQLQFRKFSELFRYAAAVFFLPELILHKYSVEGYAVIQEYEASSFFSARRRKKNGQDGGQKTTKQKLTSGKQ